MRTNFEAMLQNIISSIVLLYDKIFTSTFTTIWIDGPGPAEPIQT